MVGRIFWIPTPSLCWRKRCFQWLSCKYVCIRRFLPGWHSRNGVPPPPRECQHYYHHRQMIGLSKATVELKTGCNGERAIKQFHTGENFRLVTNWVGTSVCGMIRHLSCILRSWTKGKCDLKAFYRLRPSHFGKQQLRSNYILNTYQWHANYKPIACYAMTWNMSLVLRTHVTAWHRDVMTSSQMFDIDTSNMGMLWAWL
jgi:hypothetical protein